MEKGPYSNVSYNSFDIHLMMVTHESSKHGPELIQSCSSGIKSGYNNALPSMKSKSNIVNSKDGRLRNVFWIYIALHKRRLFVS